MAQTGRQRIHSAVAAMQHRAATLLGIDELARTATVVTMIENNSRQAPAYWIQLFLSMGIATLGLVLGSTAVVIGAMLVSPLMGPILELGMGFAVGSSFLVFRAALRVALSVFVVVGGAALLTLALPFHEITNEIASRTAPTALDLLVAVFCALTAAYTTVRATSDTTSAAAGTAIGIALVPPLCVTGFGIGTGSPDVAGGAALLFTANLSAILVLAVMTFLVLGYNQVDAATLEKDFVGPDQTRTGRLASRTEAILHQAFGSRYGLAMRLIIPVVFLAAVFVPLRRALDEVTWEFRARDAIRGIVATEAPTAVQTATTIEHHTIALHLVLVGTNDIATSIEQRIRSAITARAGVAPDVTVTAVPDARTLALASTPRTEAVVSDAEELSRFRQHLASAITHDWPAAAGPLVGWRLTIAPTQTPSIAVWHLGPALGPVASALLAERWAGVVGGAPSIRDVPAPDSISPPRRGREEQWLAAAQRILAWAYDAERSVVCISGPVAPSRKLTSADRAIRSAMTGSDVARAGRLTLTDSLDWNIRIAVEHCVPPATTSNR